MPGSSTNARVSFPFLTVWRSTGVALLLSDPVVQHPVSITCRCRVLFDSDSPGEQLPMRKNTDDEGYVDFRIEYKNDVIIALPSLSIKSADG
ncbi:hypothetical protein ASPWEDRAFT_34192 [Aspergillus wentii DTO 134E9]|uniref:Uncharacterized protein n=1 Tax=Aspergillus wentii DTO 134E9 TaxID=1073089 RepID=A0A1L9S0M8_ASPWE|nr:uncharacterized protein ASPWEDRAFT_34192 [Aspergillus wentii DTO 134E9]OJJ40726.1 hypothetical protein ASPWEDRAFT_34192 [Aspergillus wentii DTO 134E9]